MKNDKKEIYLDLNIKKVLEDWTPEDAIREFISNALDETILSNASQEPEIYKDRKGNWHIRDFGRGLHSEDFIQNENEEKKNKKDIIGKYGVGLKDAIATLDRNNIKFEILSLDNKFYCEYRIKAGGSQEKTLHIVCEKNRERIEGTDIIVACSDEVIQKAKEKFCKYSNFNLIAETKYGDILEKKDGISIIYLNGLEIARSEEFLFSYNITKPNSKIKEKLNRERKNVGKSAYSDRIQDIILSTENSVMMDRFFKKLRSQNTRNELGYPKVQQHVIKYFNNKGFGGKEILFANQTEITIKSADITDLRESKNIEIIPVSEKVYSNIEEKNIKSEKKINTLDEYYRREEESFEPKCIEVEELTEEEKKIFNAKKEIFKVFPLPIKVEKIKIAEQLYNKNNDRTLGLWDEEEKTIYILRKQLYSLESYLGTLLHEMNHAKAGNMDATRAFESDLTETLGILAASYIRLQ